MQNDRRYKRDEAQASDIICPEPRSDGGTFVHFPKIGFDYRVRRNSIIVEALPRIAEIINYIFGKPEMACYKLLREIDEEVRNLRGSRSYRLRHRLLAPARLLRKLWRYFH